MEKIKRNVRGITLVALIITIIILLILAGITIGQLANSGLFENTKLAKEEYLNAEAKEDDMLKQYENAINTGEVASGRETVTIDKDDYEELKNTVQTLSEKVTNLEKYTNGHYFKSVGISGANKFEDIEIDPGSYLLIVYARSWATLNDVPSLYFVSYANTGAFDLKEINSGSTSFTFSKTTSEDKLKCFISITASKNAGWSYILQKLK